MVSPSSLQLFVTGTDTGVGKTYFTTWLVRAWRRKYDAIGLKPILSGGRGDAVQMVDASGFVWSLDQTNPVWLAEPAAPWVAALHEGKTIDLAAANACVRQACASFSHVAVEGVGGWRVPLTADVSVREWAQDLALPVVVVARAGLGTLSHTLLTLDSIAAAGLTCRGVVLNCGGQPVSFPARTNPEALRTLTNVPVWVFSRIEEDAGVLPDWLA